MRTRTHRRTGRAAVQVARPHCASTADRRYTDSAQTQQPPVSARIRIAHAQNTMRTDENVLDELSYPVRILRRACGVCCAASCAVPSTAAVRCAALSAGSAFELPLVSNDRDRATRHAHTSGGATSRDTRDGGADTTMGQEHDGKSDPSPTTGADGAEGKRLVPRWKGHGIDELASTPPCEACLDS